MKPVNFKQSNLRLLGPLGEDDPNILPLPVYNDGKQTISCWEATPEEMEIFARTGKIYFLVAAGKSSPPVLPMIVSPFKNSREYAHDFFYFNTIMNAGFWVYNYVDADVPLKVKWEGATYDLTDRAPIFELNKVIGYGEMFIDFILDDEQKPSTKPVLCIKLSGDNNIKYEVIPDEFFARFNDPEQVKDLIDSVKKVLEDNGIATKSVEESMPDTHRPVGNYEGKILALADENKKKVVEAVVKKIKNLPKKGAE